MCSPRCCQFPGSDKTKCEAGGVEYDPRALFSRERIAEARAIWEKGLGYLTKELPDFRTVVSELRETLAFLGE